MFKKIKTFIKEVYAESKNITWPTRSQTIFFTVAVLVVSIVIAYYLGLLDSIFTKGLGWIITR